MFCYDVHVPLQVPLPKLDCQAALHWGTWCSSCSWLMLSLWTRLWGVPCGSSALLETRVLLSYILTHCSSAQHRGICLHGECFDLLFPSIKFCLFDQQSSSRSSSWFNTMVKLKGWDLWYAWLFRCWSSLYHSGAGKIMPINLANSLTDVDSFSLAFLQAAGLAPVGTSPCWL